MYKSNKRSRLLSQNVDDEEEKRKERKMKYDFVCKSDPVSHINNRKTTTQDKSNRRKKHKRDSSFTALT